MTHDERLEAIRKLAAEYRERSSVMLSVPAEANACALGVAFESIAMRLEALLPPPDEERDPQEIRLRWLAGNFSARGDMYFRSGLDAGGEAYKSASRDLFSVINGETIEGMES